MLLQFDRHRRFQICSHRMPTQERHCRILYIVVRRLLAEDWLAPKTAETDVFCPQLLSAAVQKFRPLDKLTVENK